MPAYTPEAPAAASNGDVRTLAKPPVRKLAKDLGVDISSLVGSGEGGVVTREDVQAASGLGTPLVDEAPAAPSSTTEGRERRASPSRASAR